MATHEQHTSSSTPHWCQRVASGQRCSRQQGQQDGEQCEHEHAVPPALAGGEQGPLGPSWDQAMTPEILHQAGITGVAILGPWGSRRTLTLSGVKPALSCSPARRHPSTPTRPHHNFQCPQLNICSRNAASGSMASMPAARQCQPGGIALPTLN